VPSALHEVLVSLFRDAPEALLGLLGDRLDVLASPGLQFVRDEPNLSQLIEIDSDLVFQLRGPGGKLLCALIVEVQLSIDREKERAWVAYQAGTHRRLACPTYVIVIAVDAAVAHWASGPFCTGQTTFAPIVLGPRQVPIVHENATHASLELTLLSGLAHANHPQALEIGDALWKLIDKLDPSHGGLYWDLFLNAITDSTKKALMMRLDHYQPQSDWGKGIYAEGKLEGEAEALAVLLDARGFPMTAEYRARVAECTDQAQLHAWLRSAATAESLAAVFEPS